MEQQSDGKWLTQPTNEGVNKYYIFSKVKYWTFLMKQKIFYVAFASSKLAAY